MLRYSRMHKIKDHADGEVPNDPKFVVLLWKVGAKVSGGKSKVQSARWKNKNNFALKIFISFFKLL